MNTKNILTLLGAILGLQGIGIFLGAEAISTEAFAALSPDATGIRIGTIMHEVVAVVNLMVAAILLCSRNLEPAAGAKVLLGASIGLLLTLSHAFYNLFATDVKPPIPLLAIMTVVMLLAFITARKAGDTAGE
jgi:hypothetical protein